MIDIQTASMIPGWMTCDELTWLAEAASVSHCIAEVGSWRGRSTRALADHTPGFVFAIDPWDDRAQGHDAWWRRKEPPEHYQQPNWLWRDFEEAMGEHLYHKVLPLRMLSIEAANEMQRNMLKFDMIFIDADHNYESVVMDILAWQPLLKPGGLLCGHDYGHPDQPGVKQAVDQFISRVNLLGTIWWCEL